MRKALTGILVLLLSGALGSAVHAQPAATATDSRETTTSQSGGRPDGGGSAGPGGGQESQGPPPAPVTVAPVTMATIAPDVEFIGTVFFHEVSEVAAELSGRVDAVLFDEGRRLAKDEPLIRLDSKLLEKSLAAARAELERTRVQLEQAETDLQRERRLFEQKVSEERAFDDARFNRQALQSSLQAQQAQVQRMEIELEKMSIHMPFDGVILERHTDVGEWIATGGTIATVANAHLLDIHVDIPERLLPQLEVGMELSIEARGKRMTGKLDSIIPQGDIVTRTFPIKVRLEDVPGLYQGMEARVRLPAEPPRELTAVPRDALLRQQGQEVVYSVGPGGMAQPHFVEVLGYQKLLVGIQAPDLAPDARVIVKGHERLQPRPGQAVRVINDQYKIQDGGPTPPERLQAPPSQSAASESENTQADRP